MVSEQVLRLLHFRNTEAFNDHGTRIPSSNFCSLLYGAGRAAADALLLVETQFILSIKKEKSVGTHVSCGLVSVFFTLCAAHI